MLCELELDAVLACDVPLAMPVPKHQASWRDIALVVRDDVTHDRLVDALARDPSALVRSVLLFDVYRPAQPGGDIGVGEHSMALRLELLDDEANLTDERIDEAVAAAVQRVQTAFGARLRG
jgi:phenylalanyl-tRNA synthetase beta chain